MKFAFFFFFAVIDIVLHTMECLAKMVFTILFLWYLVHIKSFVSTRDANRGICKQRKS